MKVTTKQTKQVDEITDVICNKCGMSCYPNTGGCDNFCGLGAVVWGNYDSAVLKDAAEYKFDICEKCLVKLFKTFKIPVEIKDLNAEYSKLYDVAQPFDWGE